MNDDPSSSQPTKSWLDRITDAFTVDPKSRNELIEILRDAHDRQLLDAEALSIIEGAMQVSDMQVREIMIPRSRMVAVKANQTPAEFLPKIIESKHSRFPVLGDSQDELVGILLAKDLLPLALGANLERFNLKDLVRPANFVPESKRLNVLLREFRATRHHMAIVVDEFGGIAGLITIEDVLEQIVGDIEDEHDVDDDIFIKKLEEDLHTVKASTPLEEFNQYFNTHHSEDQFDTIGGFVTHNFGHLPRRNETIMIGHHLFKVINADNRRIRLLQVKNAMAEASK